MGLSVVLLFYNNLSSILGGPTSGKYFSTDTCLKTVARVDYHDPDAEGLAREEVFRYQELSAQNGVLTPCPDGYCQDCWDNNCAYFLDSPFPCKHVKSME